MHEKQERLHERRTAIVQILRSERIENQVQLLRRLRSRGYRVTQPSVSRDLQELGAAKVDGRYRTPDALAAPSLPRTELADVAGLVLGVANAGPHLIVVKTPPGAASSVGIAIDRAAWPEIVGTVAGDDTLFIATAGRRHQVRAASRLARLISEKLHA